MSPSAVMQRAKELGIDVFALTDHNSVANYPAYLPHARQHGITLIPGLEVQTAEDLHLVALFDQYEQAAAFSQELYQSLPFIPNDPDFYGDQVVLDADENIIRFEEKALINSSFWAIDEVVEKVRSYGGFVRPAHINSEPYGILYRLGFIPAELDFAVLELSANCPRELFCQTHPELASYSFITASDAHYLIDMGKGLCRMLLANPSIKEIEMACRNLAGRKILL